MNRGANKPRFVITECNGPGKEGVTYYLRPIPMKSRCADGACQISGYLHEIKVRMMF